MENGAACSFRPNFPKSLQAAEIGEHPPRRSTPLNGKLYIGNLPSSTTEADLQTKFEQFGHVLSVAIETDAATGRSKRSGLVEMETGAEAQAAIDRLNMTQYDDVVISVYKVRPARSARIPCKE